jgi:hypothetical protein
MSPREKRLLIFLGAAVFVIVHVAALKMFFLPQLASARSDAKSFQDKSLDAEFRIESQEENREEIDWLLKYEPQPITPQDAESQLEELANREAQRRGLEVKRRKIQPKIEDPALKYHRARVDLEVSGSERVLYQWLDRLHSPADFRAVTSMTMSPKRDDDTQIDCRITVEQWFIPKTKDS